MRASWSRATEDLYSAWIQKLFDAPLDAEPSWPTLRAVLHDRSRNMLFNYLGAGEDEVSAPISPDCADLVYFLRAYFAFKMGLPFGYSNCSRGGGGDAPKCYSWLTNLNPPAAAQRPGLAAGFVRAVARLPRAKALVLAGSLMGGEIEQAVREVRQEGLLVISRPWPAAYRMRLTW